MSFQITNSFTAEPTHKAVGTFGSLTSVTEEDKAFVVREPQILREYLGEPEPLVVILGWAGASHKVKLYRRENLHISKTSIVFSLRMYPNMLNCIGA